MQLVLSVLCSIAAGALLAFPIFEGVSGKMSVFLGAPLIGFGIMVGVVGCAVLFFVPDAPFRFAE